MLPPTLLRNNPSPSLLKISLKTALSGSLRLIQAIMARKYCFFCLAFLQDNNSETKQCKNQSGLMLHSLKKSSRNAFKWSSL